MFFSAKVNLWYSLQMLLYVGAKGRFKDKPLKVEPVSHSSSILVQWTKDPIKYFSLCFEYLFLFFRKVSLLPQKCLPLMAFSRTRMSKVMWQVVHWWSLFTEWCPGLTVVYLHLDMPVWVRESLYDWVGKIFRINC